MSKKLYVGNLPFSMTEDQLHDLFSKEGVVNSTKLIIDRYSGHSKGFGFVEMTNDDEASNTIGKMNNFEFEGRKIVVNEARPMKKTFAGAGGGGRDFGGQRKPKRW